MSGSFASSKVVAWRKPTPFIVCFLFVLHLNDPYALLALRSRLDLDLTSMWIFLAFFLVSHGRRYRPGCLPVAFGSRSQSRSWD